MSQNRNMARLKELKADTKRKTGMSNAQVKSPRNCFKCLKKAATRNAIITMALTASLFAVAISAYQMA